MDFAEWKAKDGFILETRCLPEGVSLLLKATLGAPLQQGVAASIDKALEAELMNGGVTAEMDRIKVSRFEGNYIG
jgi:hypothetical protein